MRSCGDAPYNECDYATVQECRCEPTKPIEDRRDAKESREGSRSDGRNYEARREGRFLPPATEGRAEARKRGYARRSENGTRHCKLTRSREPKRRNIKRHGHCINCNDVKINSQVQRLAAE
jgi:hypothetical protein